MAQRPRASILSLFDPLSLSTSSDKENSAAEASFFHHHVSQTPVQRTLRRRLIDVGDVTVDEPDIQDLLAMDDELEEIKKNITDNDDGDTLTWRDMAKAATPKWSGRHATSFTTPKASPRTPLAELSFKDDTTPMARKKSYRRQIVPATSKLALVESPPTSPLALEFSSLTLNTKPLTIDLPTPTIEISDTEPDTEPVAPTASPHDALKSSVCTLNILPLSPADNLIADSSLPLDISPTSSQSSQSNSMLASLAPPSARLRPNALSPSNTDHRMSVDLQSSFQLHLSSSDTTFDLLNEKISFFSSKIDDGSFLNSLEADASFGEDDLKPLVAFSSNLKNSEGSSKASTPANSEEQAHSVANRVFIPKSDAETQDTRITLIKNRVTDNLHDITSSPYLNTGSKTSSVASLEENAGSVLSTPSSSNPLLYHPPPAIPALKIVKRSKLLSRRLSTAVNAISSTSTSKSTSTSTPSRRISLMPPTVLPAGRAKTAANVPPSPANGSVKSDRVTAPPGALNVKRNVSSTYKSNPSASGDGPRRVLVSEGPKLISLSNTKVAGTVDSTKASMTVNGPRRIAADTPSNVPDKPMAGIKPTAPSQPNTGLRQPVKYSTLGSSSAIPKPISRTTGSRLPGPSSGMSRTRFGMTTTTSNVPTRELQGR